MSQPDTFCVYKENSSLPVFQLMTTQEFKTAILPLQHTMYRSAFILLRSEEDAADVVQETVARLWENRSKLPDLRNLRAYVLTAVRNSALSMIRNSHEASDISDTNLHACDDGTADLEYRETLSILENALRQLPESQQTVIRLSSFGDRSNEEIAEITGLTNMNVRALLSRGRRKLRELIMYKI